MKPTSLRGQSGCHNCQHAFHRYEYEETATLYCTKLAPARPRCGSVAMGELICDEPWPDPFDVPASEAHEAKVNAGYDAWHEWSAAHRVNASDICDEHEATT